jgi:hypothetical protein
MGVQSIQEALCNHWYRAFMKRLAGRHAAAPVLRDYNKNAKDFVPSHRGFCFFPPARWTLVLLNNDAQKATSSFLSKEQGG